MVPHTTILAILIFSGSLTSIFSKFSHQNSFKFSGSLEGKNVLQSRKNDGTGVTELREIGGQTWQKRAILKPPLLPQFGADSPRSKTVYLRVRRTITRIIQIGGLTPLRG